MPIHKQTPKSTNETFHRLKCTQRKILIKLYGIAEGNTIITAKGVYSYDSLGWLHRVDKNLTKK